MIKVLLVWAQITSGTADKLQQTATMKEAKSAILCLAFSPNGKVLASGEVDKKIRLWDTAAGKQLAVLEGHTKQVAALAFSPDGATLHSAGYDATVRLWDVASGKPKEVQAGDPNKGVLGPHVDDMRTSFSRDGSLLAFGSFAAVWDVKAKKLLPFEILGVRGWFDFEPDGSTILTVCGSQKEPSQFQNFERWSLKTHKAVARWDGTPGATYERIAVSDDGAWAAVIDAGGDDNRWKVEIWNVTERKRTQAPGFHPAYVNGMAFTRDGSALATAALDKTMKLWDVKTGKELASYTHDRGFMGMAFSADGSRMATADDKGGIQLWGPK